jgi:hypothetical protein
MAGKVTKSGALLSVYVARVARDASKLFTCTCACACVCVCVNIRMCMSVNTYMYVLVVLWRETYESLHVHECCV